MPTPTEDHNSDPPMEHRARYLNYYFNGVFFSPYLKKKLTACLDPRFVLNYNLNLWTGCLAPAASMELEYDIPALSNSSNKGLR